ncbi:G5 domain-containing protein, partial [Facklamia hominis]
MEKNYRYAIRKTTLGVGSVAIAAILAGQVQTVEAREVDLPQETVQAQNKAVTDSAPVDDRQEVDDSEGLALSDENVPTAVAQANAPASTEPNYGEDEKNIKDYDGSNRYKETDLQPGDTNQTLEKNDEKVEKDGFKFELKNPSETSPSKTEYGYQITIDKKTGQRTYTKVTVTDSGLIPVNPGDKPMMNQGDKLIAESPAVSYKPTENTELTASVRQRNLNYEASKETLEHINNKDNDSTSFGFKDNYTQAKPGTKFFGDSFGISYKVNPWPNENDKLQELKLNKNNYDSNKKHFVQGQDIDTGIKVDNIDESAKERLVGQVYNPITGKIVPGAKAYIGDNGNIFVKMPEGALTKDKDGKTIIKEDSIFNTPDYKGIQNLDVKFFARPRTADEFNAIAQAAEDEWDRGTYVGTSAGTATINHKGKDVVIDKQGIDRYDHYNLIGNFKLNLDDTRYYDQKFEDGNGDDTSKVTSSGVKPGEPFKVGIVEPENPGETDKSAAEMNEAQNKGEASGKLILDFINRENKGKAPEDQWKVDVDPNDIANFTVTAPKSAKAGDFVAIPLEYTYTNGSKDVHWFHFVVQESTYIKPEYDTQVNFPVNEQTSAATVTEDGKRIPPSSYTLPDTLETDEAGNKLATDDKGNKWTVKVDETTGKVTAKPVDPLAFNGGEKLAVPVIAHYVDEQKPGEDITEEVNAYFVIEERANMTARYNAKAGKSGDQLSSDVILNTEDKYNRRPGKYTLESDTYVDDKGNTWHVTIDENTGKVTATVPNAEEGKSIDGALLNVPVTAHYYEEDGKLEVGTKKTEAQFMAYGTNGKVEKTVEVPFETKVEKDPNLKKGEIKVITEGKVGSKKVTYTIEDSKIIKEEEKEIEAPQERLIHVGEGVNNGTHKIEEKVEVGFETEVEFDDSLAPGEKKVTQEGEPGEKTRTTTLTIEDGQVTKTEVGEFTETKAPKKRIIKVGRNTEGKVEHKEELPFKYKVEEVDTLKKGEYKIVKPGKVGTKTTTWTIKNSQIDGKPTETIDPAEDALIQVGKGTNDGTHEVLEKKAIDYKTIIEYDENLDAGQQEVVKEGNPGEQERTNTLVIKDGQVTETQEGEFKTTKEATDRVVKVGTKPVTKVVEKPFNTEYVYDENLESGKTEEVTPGKNGKVTITTTYDKDQKKVVTSETEEKGQNRVVKIGGKTNGTEKVKEEIPFEVEVRKDPSLKKGEWKYATDDEGNELKGEKGEQERTLTIENSKVTNTSEPTVTKKAKNAVILIGEGTNDGTHKIEEKVEVPFETEIQFDDSLKPGETKEVQKGELGEKTRTNTLTIEDGKVTKTEMGEFTETKAPKKRIIKVGRNTEGKVEHKEELPFGYKVEEVEDLKKGEYRIVKTGKVGTRTTTWTIKNSQIDGEPTVTEVAPEDALIQVGKGTNDGTHEIIEKKEIPFETRYEYDDSLKPGEEKIVTPGSPGEQERTNTLVIKDGKVVETKEGEFKTTKEPQERLIKIGRKSTEGETTKTIEREIPYETKVIYDDTLEAGFQKIEKEGKPGKEEVTITQKIKDSKPVGDPTETTKTITEKEDRVVRVGVKLVVKETELGNNTEYRHNPNLKAGEEKVIEEGSKGSVKYTTTFNKETGKLEVTEERTEPKNKVVEYGSKTDGEFTYESEKAYDIIIRENPNLEAGKTKVIQEGKPGKTETTVKIENSKEVSRDTKTITEKQDKIIEIGTKNVCEIPPVDPEDPEKPGKEDPEKPG